MRKSKAMLRPGEVGPLLGVSRSRAYQLIRQGVIPAIRVGGSIRVPVAAWERWLEQQSEAALAALRTDHRG